MNNSLTMSIISLAGLIIVKGGRYILKMWLIKFQAVIGGLWMIGKWLHWALAI